MLHDDLAMASFHGSFVFGEFVGGDDVIVVGVASGGGEDEGVGGEGAAEGVVGLTGCYYEGCFLLEVEELLWCTADRSGSTSGSSSGCLGGSGGGPINYCSGGNTHRQLGLIGWIQDAAVNG